MTNDMQQIIELVVYRLKNDPGQDKQLIVEQTNAALSKLEGYIDRRVYQSVEDPCILVDFVTWDSIVNAENAAKQMADIPELLSFVQLIEKTEIFEHFSIANQHAVNGLDSDAIELVVYRLKEEENQRIGAFFDTYSEVVAHAAGYQGRVLLHSGKENNVWAERVFWKDSLSAAENEKAMQQNAQLASAFSMVEELIIMKHCKALK